MAAAKKKALKAVVAPNATPCQRTQEELDSLLENSARLTKNTLLFTDYFFLNKDAAQVGFEVLSQRSPLLPRCLGCGCSIGEHAPAQHNAPSQQNIQDVGPWTFDVTDPSPGCLFPAIHLKKGSSRFC